MADKRITKLKRRLSTFLCVSGAARDANEILACAVKDVLQRPAARGWRTYLVGGVLRDLLLAPAEICPRDIDFMVEGASQNELDREFRDLIERRTRFGGLHLVKMIELPLTTYAVHFDAWCLQDTWALKVLDKAPTIENFLETPFLNIDCVAARLDASCTPELFLNGFFDAIDSQTLEINYAPNPFPLVCVVRALILSVQLQFAIGPRLAQFACEHARTSLPADLMEAQLSHYGVIRVQRQELYDWLRSIERQLQSGIRRIRLLAPKARQIALWNDWPPIAPVEIQNRVG